MPPPTLSLSLPVSRGRARRQADKGGIEALETNEPAIQSVSLSASKRGSIENPTDFLRHDEMRTAPLSFPIVSRASTE